MMIALPKVVLLSLIVQCKNKASFKTYKTITKQNKTKNLEKKQFPNTENGKTIQCKQKTMSKDRKIAKNACIKKKPAAYKCVYFFILLFCYFCYFFIVLYLNIQ